MVQHVSPQTDKALELNDDEMEFDLIPDADLTPSDSTVRVAKQQDGSKFRDASRNYMIYDARACFSLKVIEEYLGDEHAYSGCPSWEEKIEKNLVLYPVLKAKIVTNTTFSRDRQPQEIDDYMNSLVSNSTLTASTVTGQVVRPSMAHQSLVDGPNGYMGSIASGYSIS